MRVEDEERCRVGDFFSFYMPYLILTLLSVVSVL